MQRMTAVAPWLILVVALVCGAAGTWVELQIDDASIASRGPLGLEHRPPTLAGEVARRLTGRVVLATI